MKGCSLQRIVGAGALLLLILVVGLGAPSAAEELGFDGSPGHGDRE